MNKFNQLTKLLIEANKRAYHEVTTRNSNEHFYVYSLCLSFLGLDTINIYACVNSFEKHQKNIDRFDLELDTPDEEHYKWQPEEWGDYIEVGWKHFEEVLELIEEIASDFTEEMEKDFSHKTLMSMRKSLENLVSEGFWESGQTIHLYDFDEKETHYLKKIKTE